MTSRVDRIEFLVTSTEAEALLAEQTLHQAPPAALQHPPARRQVLPLRLRQPRRGLPAGLLHPREAPLRPRLLRPLLQRQAGARDARPARQALPVPHLRGQGARAAAPAAPASTTTSSAAGRPASATSAARSTATTSTRSSTSSPAATARSRPTSRRRWRRRRSGTSSSAPPCTATGCRRSSSLFERQRVAGGTVGTADLIGVAAEGAGRQRPGLPGARRDPRRAPELLPRQPGRTRPRRGRRGVRRPVLLGLAGGAAHGRSSAPT